MSKLIILFVIVFLITNTTYGSPITPAPTTCGRNEEYLAQGTAPNCDTVCSELGERCTRVYIQAPFGCYCVEGTARDDKNVCIPISQCPPKNSKPCGY